MMSDDGQAAPLWKFVTDHPLVFGAEVLTKFDEFDLKIFYDLCRASREVVIRSNIELNNEIRHVENVKSMQELALAWDNYRFGEINMVGGDMTQEKFCVQVAWTNNLDFLKWAREVKQCAWDEDTIIDAAAGGKLDMVKYCVENDCPMNADVCSHAALNGHLDVLKYLHEHDCPWDSWTCNCAHRFNRIECLNYAIEQKCPGWKRYLPEGHPDYDPEDEFSSSSDEEEFISDVWTGFISDEELEYRILWG
jgi:hypothetical protein